MISIVTVIKYWWNEYHNNLKYQQKLFAITHRLTKIKMMVQIFNTYIITVTCFPWGIITKQKFLLIFYFTWQIYETDLFQCLLPSQQISRFIKGGLYFRFETKNHTRILKTKTKKNLRKSFWNKISVSKL